MSNNSSVPGITYPTVQSTGAGSPRDAAIANNAAMNAKQAEANKMTAGSKKKGGAVTVGVPQVSYTPTGGPGQDLHGAGRSRPHRPEDHDGIRAADAAGHRGGQARNPCGVA